MKIGVISRRPRKSVIKLQTDHSHIETCWWLSRQPLIRRGTLKRALRTSSTKAVKRLEFLPSLRA
jgi:hypothetical protein